MNKDFVWYAAYGSNLCFQRFICYIKGGRPFFGESENTGCADREIPNENRQIEIPFSMYFASKNDGLKSIMWGRGGVAFLDKKNRGLTYGRMWKIKQNQYEEIRKQESLSLYDEEIILGYDLNRLPIKTITSSSKIEFTLKPSSGYLMTMTRGLCQTYGWSGQILRRYFENIEGYKN
ncbi:hypothetical protein JXA84_04200 [candidate division WOR-3 bacterium]|nr:hypothetical protein [candidate division WOR-3 bacterium]